MDAVARITSKGQITVPAVVRAALGVEPGDMLLFRVDAGVATVARTPDLLDLAGAVPVPEDVAGLSWDEVRERAWAAAARRGG